MAIHQFYLYVSGHLHIYISTHIYSLCVYVEMESDGCITMTPKPEQERLAARTSAVDAPRCWLRYLQIRLEGYLDESKRVQVHGLNWLTFSFRDSTHDLFCCGVVSFEGGTDLPIEKTRGSRFTWHCRSTFSEGFA